MARLTLYGIYQYDNTLFNDIVLPDGIEKEILIAEIFSHSGDLYPYYQVPPILKQNISYWFLRRRYDFEQMQKALNAEYSPIENYNRYEDLKRHYKNSGSDGTIRTYKNDGNSTDTTTLGTQSDTTNESHDIESVSAYNASDYTPRTKTDRNGTNTVTNSGTDTSSNTTHSSSTDNATMTYGALRDETEENHTHGNIGVTTTQQMIESEIALRQKYDLYAMIADLFEKEFIIQLY